MAISRQQVNATTVVYSIARGVLDEIKPCNGELSESYDNVTFAKTMQALEKKSEEVANG